MLLAVGDPQSAASSPHFSRRCIGYPAPLSCQSAYLQYATIIRRVRPWRRAYSRGLSHMGFHAAAANCASSRHSILRLWRGPSPRAYSRGLSHIGFHAATANCASLRHSILRLWRGPSPRAYSRGLSHMGFHAVATNCTSSRHSILRLWRGPSPRAYSREEYSSPWSPVTLSSSVSATV